MSQWVCSHFRCVEVHAILIRRERSGVAAKAVSFFGDKNRQHKVCR